MSMHYIELGVVNSTHLWAQDNLCLLQGGITCITATEQTAGVGQGEHKWISPPDVNLYATYCFPLDEKKSNYPNLAQIASIAIAIVLETTLQLEPTIKWPNDVLINGKKCAGVLCHIKDQVAIVSVGLNVNMTQEQVDQIDQPSTSLSLETGEENPIRSVRELVSKQLVIYINKYIQDGNFESFFPSYERLLSPNSPRVDPHIDNAGYMQLIERRDHIRDRSV